MANAADIGPKLLAWLMTGTGALLAYSAFRKQNPLDVLRGTMVPTTPGFTGPTGFMGSSFGSATGYASEPVRLRMLGNQEIKPDLVDIKPSGKLDRTAAASKARIDAKLGYAVPNVGAYRSFAYQAAQNAANPERFASPSGSMHVAGLAIDIHSAYKDKPEVIAAFTQEGWHRYDPVGESHHWSYGVIG